VLERFTIAPIPDGIGLVPRTRIDEVRLIEIVDGAIAIDGDTVSGSELRERLTEDDAALVVQLSYLDEAGRAALLDSSARDAPAVAPAQVAPEPPARPRGPRRRRSRDIVRFGGNVTVGAGEQVDGNVVVILGNANVDGEVDGDVVVIGGRLRLGDGASVDGDVVAMGPSFIRAPNARIGGDVVNLGQMRFGPPDINVPGPFGPPFGGPFGLSTRRAIGITATLLRLGLLMILGWLFFAVAGDPVQRIAARASAEPLKAGAIGVLVELLFVPMLIMVSILLAISVIGIPLLVLVPVAVLVMILVLLIGFTAVSMRVGQWAGTRLGAERTDGYAAVTLGVIVLLSLAVLARLAFLTGGPLAAIGATLLVIAFCVEYVAWTIGLGASVLVRFAPGPQPAGPHPQAPLPGAPPAPPQGSSEASPGPPPAPPPATTEGAPPAAE
jgi:hypothetical protein